MKFAKIGNERRFLVSCVIMSSVLLILIVLIQSYRSEIFGTTLMLGWDSPAYVWLAKYVLIKGPIHMAHAWSFPHLYVQLLAFFGYLYGNIVIVERILPLTFCVFLIYVNSKIIFRISKNVYIAGLAAFLTVFSVNVLRVFSDLNRNLMALSLSFAVFLLVPNIDPKKSILNKKYLFFILILFIIAGTHFETYFILALSLLLYGLLGRNLKKLSMLILASLIPVAILISLFPAYFFGYMGTVVVFQQELTFSDIVMWTGGSWIILAFLIMTSCLFYKSKLRNNEPAPLVFSWCFIIFLIVISIGLHIAPFSREFALRSLYNMPTPLLLALAISGCEDHLKNWRPKWVISFSKKGHSIKINVNQLLLVLIVLSIIVSSIFTVIQNCGGFLTPFISHSSYEKIVKVKEYFADRNLSVPIVVFRGDPPVRFVNLYRNYIGAEIGEHFAYYGDIPNLFHLLPSQPKIKSNEYPYLSHLEKYYLTFYYDELIGNVTGPPPPLYYHDSYVTNETLISHPILIVTPDFYNEAIPCYVKPFYIGEGIYVILPNSSINSSEIIYGPEVTVVKNGKPTRVNSTYTYIDPYDPSIVYLKVNALSGYTSYNFTNFPSNWVFQRIEQGGDIRFPEVDPRRINGTKAYGGNDPADSMNYWSSPWLEQDATLEIDTSAKKEGYASLKITGKTDSWGCLSVRYDSPGTWNLSAYSSIGVWAKSNKSTTFSISLVDSDGRSRTFWCLKAGEGSVATDWKRFVANLTDYTSETSGFNISAVDHIHLYVYSDVEDSMTFWIDDLTVDTSLDLEKFVYKGRVPVDETVVAYFYTCIEDE